MSNPRVKFFDKLIGGIEIRNKLLGKNNTIGTLGMIVYDQKTGLPLGLSNSHILEKGKGTFVYQPGINGRNKWKRNRGRYRIGRIHKVSNSYDCAVFSIDLSKRNINSENAIHGLDGLPTEVAKWYEGLKVKKVGKNTGLTYGIVKGDVLPSGQKMKEGTFCIIPNPDKPAENNEISIGGDSGAIWVTDEKDYKVVGLHFAGERKERYGEFASAIEANVVMKELNITFIKPE